LSKKKRAHAPATKGFVVDRSIDLAWCFFDERDEYSQLVRDGLAIEPAIVPELWHLEVANALVMGERRKRSTQAETVDWMSFLSDLPIAVDEETKTHAFADITHLARLHTLSVYDAAYLELAMRRSLPLATLVEDLRLAAKAVGVVLYGIQ
jgi:predicted nucleic acid-binding protein